MIKKLWIAALLLISLVFFSTLDISAVTTQSVPYETYTIGPQGRRVLTQTAYEPAGYFNTSYTLNNPEDLYIKDDYVYVADTGNQRILKIDQEGQAFEVITDLNAPTGVHVDEDYNIYVADKGDKVIDIAKGPENSVLVLTDKGLGQIFSKEMTLHDKAIYYDKQVRNRHIRFGFNAGIVSMTDGDITTGSMRTSDNDGLWTTMYLAGEVFRYSVTKSEEALQNIRESLDALDRLYTINPIPGFPSRSFERRGYKYHDKPWRGNIL